MFFHYSIVWLDVWVNLHDLLGNKSCVKEGLLLRRNNL